MGGKQQNKTGAVRAASCNQGLNLFKISLSTASLHVSCDGDVVTLMFRGLVGRKALAEAVQGWQAGSACKCARAGYVARFDEAVWLDGDSEDFAMLPGALRMARSPVALVTRPQDEAWFRRYAQEQSRNGVVRGVFTDAGQAASWVRGKASVLYRQSQYRIPAAERAVHALFAVCRHPLRQPFAPLLPQ